jgi:hypothetical protein
LLNYLEKAMESLLLAHPPLARWAFAIT